MCFDEQNQIFVKILHQTMNYYDLKIFRHNTTKNALETNLMSFTFNIGFFIKNKLKFIIKTNQHTKKSIKYCDLINNITD